MILYCEHESGQAALHADTIDSIAVGDRTYDIRDHLLSIEGFPPPVIAHDVEDLLQIAIFRLLTPAEQEALTAKRREASSVKEGAGSSSKAPTTSATAATAVPTGKKASVNNGG
jgi:hypothetical protein